MATSLEKWKDAATARDIEYEKVRELRREIHHIKMTRLAQRRLKYAIETQKKLEEYLQELTQEDTDE